MILNRKIFLVLIAASISAASCTPSAKYLREKSNPPRYENNFVRVLIGTETQSFRISAESALKVKSKKTGKLLYEMKSGKLVFYPDRVNEVYVVESEENILYINNRGYRGSFEIHGVLGKVHIVNVINIEEYLYSVVPSEMPAGWNIEALKAQAVASRTYTYYWLMKDNSKSIFDVDATTSFQVYKGIVSEKKQSTDAVNATAGIIMIYNYEPILAYFHSTSGGKTADDKYVWKGADLPYLESVKCMYSRNSPYYSWETKFTIQEIQSALKKKYSGIGKINNISFKKNDDRVYEVVIVHGNGTITMSGNDFRLLVSPTKLRSTFFKSERKGNTLYISGHGWGHGVGMCQWGAKGRADEGQKYQQILTAYYKGITFKKITNNYLAHKKGTSDLVN